jgi:hypothetical protein
MEHGIIESWDCYIKISDFQKCISYQYRII